MFSNASSFVFFVWATSIVIVILIAVPVPVLANDGYDVDYDDYEDDYEDDYDYYSETQTFIEPDVRRYTSVLPREVCQQLIDLGESTGFALDVDSIDAFDKASYGLNSQAIDVMSESGLITAPSIFEVLKPYVPAIAELVRDQRNPVLHKRLFPDESPEKLPKLGWIFYRKYAPESARNALVPHFDTNVHTVNIALNDDFTGGGVFYVKPTFEVNPTWDYDQEENFFVGELGDGVPDLDVQYMTYDWVNSLNGTNTSEVVFPHLEAGDALIHNYTVWHAVAPIQTGVRYSMVLFFDMHNPMIKRENYEDDEDEIFQIKISHQIKECNPEGKLVYIKDAIDIFWEHPEDRSLDVNATRLNVRPGKSDNKIRSFLGHTFKALRSIPKGAATPPAHTRKVVSSVTVTDKDITDLEFVGAVTSQEECDLKTQHGAEIRLAHEVRECNSEGKLVYIEDDIDVYWEDPEDENSLLETHLNMRPGELGQRFGSWRGHTFRAFRSRPVLKGTNTVSFGPPKPLEGREVLASITVVDRGNAEYAFVGSVTSQADCDSIAHRVQQDEL